MQQNKQQEKQQHPKKQQQHEAEMEVEEILSPNSSSLKRTREEVEEVEKPVEKCAVQSRV